MPPNSTGVASGLITIVGVPLIPAAPPGYRYTRPPPEAPGAPTSKSLYPSPLTSSELPQLVFTGALLAPTVNCHTGLVRSPMLPPTRPRTRQNHTPGASS